MNKLTQLAEDRENIYPILSDAQLTENYEEYFTQKLIAYFKIFPTKPSDIFVRNSKFLKRRARSTSTKNKSISQSESKKNILDYELEILKNSKYYKPFPRPLRKTPLLNTHEKEIKKGKIKCKKKESKHYKEYARKTIHLIFGIAF